MAELHCLTSQAQHIREMMRERIESGQFEIPMLPEVARKVVTLVDDPESDAAQLAALIQSDQSLAAHVMRIANSATYSSTSAIVSLQQAIARLGMLLIGEIALAASINSQLFHTPGFEKENAKIWQHALLTALWGKEIARIGRKNVEAMFLCGLLHSMGRPAALQLSIEIANSENIELTRDEHLLLNKQFQQELGIAAIRQWQLPVLIEESISYINRYQSAPTYGEQAAVLTGAIVLANYTLKNAPFSLSDIQQQKSVIDLHLYEDELNQLITMRDTMKNNMLAMAIS